MRKFLNLVLWTTIAMLVPVAAQAAETGGGDSFFGPGLGAGLAVGAGIAFLVGVF